MRLGLGLDRPRIGLIHPLDISPDTWLRSDLGVTTGGTFTWADQSGNGHTFSASSNMPTLSSAGIAGRPKVTFNGTTSLLTCSTNASALNNITLFLALQFSTATPGQYGFAYATEDTAGSSGIEIGTSNTNVRCVNAAGVGTPLGAAITTSPEIWTIQANAGAWTLRVNGVAQTLSPSSAVPLSGTTGSTLGGRAGGSLFFPGDLYELITRNAILTTDRIIAMERYMGRLYGIRIP